MKAAKMDEAPQSREGGFSPDGYEGGLSSDGYVSRTGTYDEDFGPTTYTVFRYSEHIPDLDIELH